MTTIGQLRTGEPIEKAMRIIRDWLNKLGVDGLSINTSYSSANNIAVLKFRYKNKDYEFRSTKQSSCRLNMHGIARVMEYKVRASIMGIEDFETSMKSYLQIENKSSFTSVQHSAEDQYYEILGVTRKMSDEEIKKKYNTLMKLNHPDMVNSEELKKEFGLKVARINEAYTEIKKERGFISNGNSR